MQYEWMGRMHAGLTRGAAQRGQGTVEYVGLILLIAVILAGVVQASQGIGDKGLATTILDELKEAVGKASGEPPAK